MDFRLSDKAEAFRREIRDFLDQEFSEEDRERARRTGDQHDWALYRKLAQRGWVSAGWPEELGGGGRDPYEMLVLYWELEKAGFPWFGLLNNGFLGHTLMALGTEQQRQDIVPRIASGAILVALGYSEPSAGSDVAACRTSARRDGDGWIIDGQKMFTTTAHVADYVFTLTRSDPRQRRHRGLTTFLVPTAAEGVEIQPIHTLGGERTNAVYLSNVRVPDSARVGEVDGGWSVVRYALGLEQAVGFADRMEAFLERAREWARRPDASGARPLQDPRVRERLAQTAVNAEVARLLRYRATWISAEGETLGVRGAMAKVFSAEAYLADANAWMDLVGPLGLVERGDPSCPGDGLFVDAFRDSPVTTIYGGTVEILRSLIAEGALDLPRSR